MLLRDAESRPSIDVDCVVVRVGGDDEPARAALSGAVLAALVDELGSEALTAMVGMGLIVLIARGCRMGTDQPKRGLGFRL